MDDIFTRLLDLTAYLSGSLLHFIGEFFSVTGLV